MLRAASRVRGASSLSATARAWSNATNAGRVFAQPRSVTIRLLLASAAAGVAASLSTTDQTTACDGTHRDHGSVAGYFSETPEPKGLGGQRRLMNEFVAKHAAEGRRVVVITSGGTTVPLERNTVRFLDNFSTGSRGAASVEAFLARDYAVLFLSRTGSMQPYGGNRGVQEVPEAEYTTIRARLKTVADAGVLCRVDFTSVDEYLFLLRAAAEAVSVMGPTAMLYLAAAVSDFYVPRSAMAQHKIQSSSAGLDIHLEAVPKMLPSVRQAWAPASLCVSFKLETDEDILLTKARGAISKYGVHIVVANLLHTRYDEVRIVDDQEAVVIRRPSPAHRIEPVFIDFLICHHDRFISSGRV